MKTFAQFDFLTKTKLLFWVGIVLSGLSIITVKVGKGDLYPFFYYKLYSQPSGNKFTFSEYRIYHINENGDTIRNKNIDRKSVSRDEMNYFLNGLMPKVIENPLNYTYKTQLKDFLGYTFPDYSKWIIMEETYNPKDIYLDTTAYSKRIIIEIDK